MDVVLEEKQKQHQAQFRLLEEGNEAILIQQSPIDRRSGVNVEEISPAFESQSIINPVLDTTE
jgi:hypothetical protein